MMRNKKLSGQSLVEYLTVLIMVVILLGVGLAGEGSVITIFLDAVHEGFDRFSSFMSLP